MKTNCPNCGAALPASRACEYCGTDCREEKPGGVTLCGKQIGTLTPPIFPAETKKAIAEMMNKTRRQPLRPATHTIKVPDFGDVVIIDGNNNKVKF